jgi:hypothetical protein
MLAAVTQVPHAMKLVRPSVLSPARTGSCLVLALLLALPFAPRTAPAASCLRPPRDVGDNLEFFGIYAALDAYSDSYCTKKADAGWMSIQQMLDNLPRFSGPEDGTGTNLWNGPLTNYMA